MKPKRNPSGRPATASSPNPIDVHVGHRLRVQRISKGMNQTVLSRELGISSQQLNKFEIGINRVSSSQLFSLCRLLDVPIAYFFDEMPGGTERQSPRHLMGAPVSKVKNPIARQESLELVRTYYCIKDRRMRRRFTDLVRAIAQI